MPMTIERLRAAIVALAVLLVLVIAGSFFYGRWHLRRVAQDLPARLGVQIQQTAQGYTLSRSNRQGRTMFTLHAARAIEFKSGGRVTLHDVEMDLYNEQDNLADTIAGSDFEFDPHSQIVKSSGEAHIVLHAPKTSTDNGTASKIAGKTLRVTTHGLVYSQKTGTATCSGEVDFQMGDDSGHAVGATYDSRRGQLLLKSDVVLTTRTGNTPTILTASSATYDRNESQVHLSRPRYAADTKYGKRNGVAETATVLLRGNGSAERLDAKGGVRLYSADGMSVTAPAMHVLLDKGSHPRKAHFSGGVRFRDDRPEESTSGHAGEVEINFDAENQAKTIVFERAAQIHQQADTGKNKERRSLAANRLVLHLSPSKNSQEQLQSAEASGNAVFTSQSTAPGHAPQKTTLAAQVLNASFAAGNQLTQMNGKGNTRLETLAANGDIDSSSGDTLQVEFAPGRPGAASKHGQPVTRKIRTAVQTGNVVLRQTAHGKNGSGAGGSVSTATAQQASYVAATDTLTLTGKPVFRDARLEMTARRMEFERTTGEVNLNGFVQATLQADSRKENSPKRQSSGGMLDGRQPVHIVAEQATLKQDTGAAIFSGRARLWEASDSIEAPVIALSRKQLVLTAYGDPQCTECVIGSFLGTPDASAEPSVFRILSRRLVYSDAERKASFLGHVRVVNSGGQLMANHAEIFLSAVSPVSPVSADRGSGNDAKNEKNLFPSHKNGPESSIEKIVATGQVRVLEPGRSATGDRLVYTVADGKFVLTGDGRNPPQVSDLDHGTVTGKVLTFASRDRAIMVSGTSGDRTITRTRVQRR